MGLIALEGMRFFAYHGYYPEENITGTNYILDVYITAEFGNAGAKDDLNSAINYERVYDICRIVMKGERNKDGTYKPYKLIETIQNRIIRGLKKQFMNLGEVRVRVRKLNPQVGGVVDWAMTEGSEKMGKPCAKCGSAMICYGDESCWCMGEDLRIYTRTYEFLRDQFKGCLCSKCLKNYEM